MRISVGLKLCVCRLIYSLSVRCSTYLFRNARKSSSRLVGFDLRRFIRDEIKANVIKKVLKVREIKLTI